MRHSLSRSILVLLCLSAFAVAQEPDEPKRTPAQQKLLDRFKGANFRIRFPQNQVASVFLILNKTDAGNLKDLPGLLSAFPELETLNLQVEADGGAALAVTPSLLALPAITKLRVDVVGSLNREDRFPPMPGNEAASEWSFDIDPKQKAVLRCSVTPNRVLGVTLEKVCTMLATMASLERVVLRESALAEADLQHLAKLKVLKSLQVLKLDDCQLPPEVVARWKKELQPVAEGSRVSVVNAEGAEGEKAIWFPAPVSAPTDTRLRRLLIERYRAALEMGEVRMALYKTGKKDVTLAYVIEAIAFCLEPLLALNPEPEKRLPIAEKYLELMERVESFTEQRERAGLCWAGDLAFARMRVIDAEILLEQTRRAMKLNPEK